MTSSFAISVYLLCVFTSAACAILLGRSYLRTRMRLLLWSSLCFLLLAANNLVVVIDLAILPEVDLRLLRHTLSLGAVLLLLIGFIWDGED
ncbi:DUF5985 family protein [Altererythrobacter sp. Root672]|uniref:DUF5985 family protein n=1 Tax=Altererythrobacter sp. Root672 TaxID=1736584 RepID=UPI0006FCBFF3|nr:DUF5985 family protein [Altererythrobacter sp. Root672]KRA79709.1 hypothetical protein ASD76_16935 [Altererythrobacter sp. Root672]